MTTSTKLLSATTDVRINIGARNKCVHARARNVSTFIFDPVAGQELIVVYSHSMVLGGFDETS